MSHNDGACDAVTMDGGRLPLHGRRVLELGHIVAGPSAGLLLADLGADVIKIERPDGGDQNRTSPSMHFSFFNRNKRSFSVDLKDPRGKALFLDLVRTADVVLDNYSPGVVERLGLGYERLTAVNPHIIYLAVKGFLPGPYENRPSLDELAQMMGGLAYMTGPAGRPLRAGSSVIDIGAAMFGVIGVLGAMLQRAEIGAGQKITAGLYETSVFWVGQHMAASVASGQPSLPMPEVGQGTRMGWGIYHLFETADGTQLFIGVTSNAHWERFCTEFNLPDLLADERLNTNTKRVQARTWLLPRVAEVARRYTAAELQERLQRINVPYAPVVRPDQLADDPHLNATNQLLAVTLRNGKTAKLPKLPYRSSAYDFRLLRPVPGLGEHTRDLLEELGHAPEEIERLAVDRVVLLGQPFVPAAER